MKPQRLPQELCQAYLLYQVLQGGIFSTGGHCMEEEGKEEGVARQARGTATGRGRTAGAGHRAQHFCGSSVGLRLLDQHWRRCRAQTSAAGYLLHYLALWASEHLFRGHCSWSQQMSIKTSSVSPSACLLSWFPLQSLTGSPEAFFLFFLNWLTFPG